MLEISVAPFWQSNFVLLPVVLTVRNGKGCLMATESHVISCLIPFSCSWLNALKFLLCCAHAALSNYVPIFSDLIFPNSLMYCS